MAPILDCLSGIRTLHLPFKSNLEHSDDSTSVGESTDSDLSFLSDEDSPKTTTSPNGMDSWSAESGIVEPIPHANQVSHEQTTMCSSSTSRLAASCDGGALDRWWTPDSCNASRCGSIEMVSLGPLVVQLSLKFRMFLQLEMVHSSPQSMESEMETAFVRANCITIHWDGNVVATGAIKYPTLEATTVEGGLQDLFLDVRVAVDDEATMVRIVGAQLKKGRVVSMFAESSTGEIYCVVRYKESDEIVALPHVVAELRELEVLRRDAKLLLYQKQLNAMMLGKLRRHRLGFESV